MRGTLLFLLLWALKMGAAAPSFAPLPLAVDNSKAAAFPPIIDQKGGSCAQASGIGYKEDLAFFLSKYYKGEIIK